MSFGSISADLPMCAELSIPVYDMLHMGGVRSCHKWYGLPKAVEEDETVGVGSPSAGEPMPDYVSRFGG